MKKILLLLMIFALLLLGCEEDLTPQTESNFQLDTFIQITLFGQDASAFDEGFDLIDQYEKILSRTISGSDVSNLNEQGSAQVSPETYELIKEAIVTGDLSEGYFDITIAPLVSLWHISDENEEFAPPSAAEIESLLPLIDYQQIKLEDNNTVSLPPGVQIDLGGIAKGYIADLLKEYYEEQGIHRGLLNLGGNVVLIGSKPGDEPFKVGVRNPDSSGYLGVYTGKDISIVASGIYERFATYEGKRYHHILNPYTGYPEENELKSITVFTPTSAKGDALSTSLFLLGVEAGYQLVENLEGTEALFITRDNEIIYTPGLEASFKLTDTSFEVLSLSDYLKK